MGQNLILMGMVLSAIPMGDYDKRITLLTRERGKITAFARGARRPNSQLLAATNPFSFGQFELYEGRSTYNVMRADIANYFRDLAQDLEKAYYGFYFLEFADYYAVENGNERELLKLLYQSLRALESDAYLNRLVRCIYELKILTINGEYPNIFSCRKCGREELLKWFSAKYAGTLCEECGSQRETVELDASTLYTMQYIVTAKIEKLYTFQVSDQVLVTLENILKSYLGFCIDRKFKSLKVLEELKFQI
ncbi:MAG: DNA repair protein RecO [Lachnospiraceae bacterium]|nr:DNA repair protein RecO [Lachnospiraceae bacterium]